MKRVEETDDHIWTWSAHRIAAAVSAGLVSAREAAESCLGRIEDVDPELNALTKVCADEALAAADQADRLRATRDELPPLHGVPVVVKNNSDQAGHATTDGLAMLKDDAAPADSAQVANLRLAGAIILGRSNTPDWGWRWFTDNDLHGRTLNPWDRGHTPGGSSGGSAVAVASGMVPLAHGNDTGGSIRYPAYACGVTGIRPTTGRVPGTYRTPDGAGIGMAWQVMTVEGPIGRCVADLKLAIEAMSARDLRDPVHLAGMASPPPARRPHHVALLRSAGGIANSQAVSAALDDAASWLGGAGYVVEEVELPILFEAAELWWKLAGEELRLCADDMMRTGSEGTRRSLANYFELHGAESDPRGYIEGWATRWRLTQRLSEFMEDFPAVLLPVSAQQAFRQDQDVEGLDSARSLWSAQWPMLAVPTLGFPAVSVPTGVADGLPTGVQLLGRRFDESRLLEVAQAIEARAGVLTPMHPC